MRIACMQPYFLPYAGYLRLFAATDLFVVLDDVQHIRRGYVHRNKLLNRAGKPEWLTLPLKPCPRNTLIRDLEWSDEATSDFVNHYTAKGLLAKKPGVWEKRLNKFPAFDGEGDVEFWGTPCDFIIKNLEYICGILKIPCHITRASWIDIPPGLKGQDRILSICDNLHATQYVNAPGGKDLYNPDAFRLHGIELKFLPEWKGSFLSVLQHIEEPGLREQIVSQC